MRLGSRTDRIIDKYLSGETTVGAEAAVKINENVTRRWRDAPWAAPRNDSG